MPECCASSGKWTGDVDEKGTIDEEEVEMIQNVFAFDDTSVEEVCTHRVDVVTLDLDDDMQVWADTIQNSRFSYYPISGEDDDDIIGVLDAKDYFRLQDKSRENVLAHAVNKPYFVPENVKADVLFRNMKRERKYFAILLDEYGGLSGIITLRDILQLLVGDFYEEDEVQEFVINEYRREFFGEGLMFYTYKRLNAKEILWYDGNVTESTYILPLPETEYNPNNL